MNLTKQLEAVMDKHEFTLLGTRKVLGGNVWFCAVANSPIMDNVNYEPTIVIFIDDKQSRMHLEVATNEMNTTSKVFIGKVLIALNQKQRAVRPFQQLALCG